MADALNYRFERGKASSLRLVDSESVTKQPKLRFATRACVNRQDIKTVGAFLEAVPPDIRPGSINNSPLLPQADNILRRIVRGTRLYLHKHQYVPVPGNQVHFARTGSVAGSDDAKAERSQICGAFNFRPAPECQHVMKKRQRWPQKGSELR